MRRLAVLPIVLAVVGLAAAAPPVQAQAAFKVPFKFESGGTKLAAGDYVVTRAGEGQVRFQQVSTGKETAFPFSEKLKPSEPPASEPRLVFDEVGNFEPSYTEYFTVYVLAEVWLSASEGYLIHTTKGAHKTRVVKAEVSPPAAAVRKR
jgi:hypothetical protein